MSRLNFQEQKFIFIAGTLGIGGAERQLFYIANTLVKKNIKVIVFSLTKNEHYEERLKEVGIRIQFGGYSRLARIFYLLKLVREERPDYVYSFHFFANVYAAIAVLFSKAVSVGSIRSDGFAERSKNSYLIFQLSFYLPRILVANSQHAQFNCAGVFGKRKISLLENVVDTEKFRFHIKHESEQLHLLFVGKFESFKRPLLFVSLINVLKENGINVRGYMVGGGSMLSEITDLIEQFNLGDRLELTGELADPRPYYYTADWLVITSEYEGSPNVVLEAMSCGLPVAGLTIPALSVFADNGVILLGKCIEDIETKMSKFTWQSRTKLAYAAKSYIDAVHSMNVLSEKLRRLFT